jgi:hypothetical protein
VAIHHCPVLIQAVPTYSSTCKMASKISLADADLDFDVLVALAKANQA